MAQTNASGRRGSLTGGAILIGVGAIFLLKNLGYQISFWAAAGTYWPALLVLLGLSKIIDYYRFGGKVSLRFREVLLVILIACFGWLAGKVAALNLDIFKWELPITIDGRRISIRDLKRSSYSYHDRMTYPIEPRSKLFVENSNGSVEINSGAAGEMKLGIKKIVYEGSESRARSIADEIKLVVQQDGDRYLIRTNRAELQNRDYDFKTDLSIELPKEVAITLHNQYGDVYLSSLVGDQEILCNSGDVEINDISGNIKLQNRYGSSRVTNIRGNANISSRYGRVTVEDISGELQLESAFSPVRVSNLKGNAVIRNNLSAVVAEDLFGTVQIDAPSSEIRVSKAKNKLKISSSYKPIVVENIAAPVEIVASYSAITARDLKDNLIVQANYNDLKAAQIGGGLQVKGQRCGITVDEVKGPVTIETTLRDITIRAARNQLTIRNEHADVTVAVASPLKHEINIANDSGNINLYLPEDASFRISAVAKSGEVESEFSGPGLSLSNDVDGRISGAHGASGPTIKLETSYGRIRLRKGELADAIFDSDRRSRRARAPLPQPQSPSRPAPRSIKGWRLCDPERKICIHLRRLRGLI